MGHDLLRVGIRACGPSLGRVFPRPPSQTPQHLKAVRDASDTTTWTLALAMRSSDTFDAKTESLRKDFFVLVEFFAYAGFPPKRARTGGKGDWGSPQKNKFSTMTP